MAQKAVGSSPISHPIFCDNGGMLLRISDFFCLESVTFGKKSSIRNALLLQGCLHALNRTPPELFVWLPSLRSGSLRTASRVQSRQQISRFRLGQGHKSTPTPVALIYCQSCRTIHPPFGSRQPGHHPGFCCSQIYALHFAALKNRFFQIKYFICSRTE